MANNTGLYHYTKEELDEKLKPNGCFARGQHPLNFSERCGPWRPPAIYRYIQIKQHKERICQ